MFKVSDSLSNMSDDSDDIDVIYSELNPVAFLRQQIHLLKNLQRNFKQIPFDYRSYLKCVKSLDTNYQPAVIWGAWTKLWKSNMDTCTHKFLKLVEKIKTEICKTTDSVEHVNAPHLKGNIKKINDTNSKRTELMCRKRKNNSNFDLLDIVSTSLVIKHPKNKQNCSNQGLNSNKRTKTNKKSVEEVEGKPVSYKKALKTRKNVLEIRDNKTTAETDNILIKTNSEPICFQMNNNQSSKNNNVPSNTKILPTNHGTEISSCIVIDDDDDDSSKINAISEEVQRVISNNEDEPTVIGKRSVNEKVWLSIVTNNNSSTNKSPCNFQPKRGNKKVKSVSKESITEKFSSHIQNKDKKVCLEQQSIKVKGMEGKSSKNKTTPLLSNFSTSKPSKKKKSEKSLKNKSGNKSDISQSALNEFFEEQNKEKLAQNRELERRMSMVFYERLVDIGMSI